MRLATWNVNSLRARMDRVLEFMRRSEVDVLAVQETKLADAAFPVQPFEELGYQVAHHGLNHWNGVAVLSRVGLDDVQRGFPGQPGYGDPAVVEARAVSALAGGIRVWSLYVPNGREQGHPHFDYKLAWLKALGEQVSGQLAADLDAALVLAGDYNIAPTDADVWSVEYYADKTHTSPPERAAFQGLLDAGLSDPVRAFTRAPKTFTYWDYQQLRFQKNRGMRIDFMLCSDAVRDRVSGASIDRDERKGKGASDHAPVLLDLLDTAPPTGNAR
ncbi:exodeoxyribonuclease III [Nakamurella aerolata]|uniref:Exodeoxyribonuclease III n=1 Tax=Nakamurella aerolata TaxID=1656892 RepID=A0A849A7Z9_9ACTN|nr:exodeoxyribonuclease III [Nakamurella aerolata]NNG34610.1 exodeoxyribonuclease III [Nakamurella aerolata]